MRPRARRFGPALLLGVLFGAPLLSAEDLPGLYLKAKEQFRLGAYGDALTTLARLESASEESGNEAFRAPMRPSLVFYRGACLAALGRADEARLQLAEFLTYQPNASLDPALYPPRVLAALEQARKLGGRRETAPSSGSGSLTTAYHLFPREISAPRVPLDESWAEGPVHYLLTSDERVAYSRLSDPVARSEFVTEFWRKRDPNPETAENEFRDEFERRVAFADLRMAQDETRGSLTDRGMVFILLGPPTYIGRKPLRTGDDTADAVGMSMYTDQDISNALRVVPSGSAQSAAIYTQMAGPNNRLPDPDGNYREVWHYRRELLPSGVSYLQVDFDFITRRGYGKNVMQRDDKTLATLETARKSMRSGVISKRAPK
jgi:GWxTD domain-containing protein